MAANVAQPRRADRRYAAMIAHTTIAFAMAVTVFRLFPKQRWLGYLAVIYAFYVGFGVSMTIHWFSDFMAGALIGTVVGAVVGTSFSRGQM